ncbi:MAG: hypothetical protein K0S45_2246 [Nitrospira sp.]|jgi:hypothetical protein|nr:hypothetical protein [Nitrospira sp.]
MTSDVQRCVLPMSFLHFLVDPPSPWNSDVTVLSSTERHSIENMEVQTMMPLRNACRHSIGSFTLVGGVDCTQLPLQECSTRSLSDRPGDAGLAKPLNEDDA